MAVTVALRVAAAAAYDQDENDEPQTGTVVVSVVKAHVCHLFIQISRYSMRRGSAWSLTIENFMDFTNIQSEIRPFPAQLRRKEKYGGSYG